MASSWWIYALLSALFLKEPLQLKSIVGTLLIVAGTLVFIL